MGGLRGDPRVVCFKLLCSDDECGRFLGFRGEHKRRCQEDFRVDLRVSAKRPDGGARCISVATPDHRAGAVLAVEHVGGLLAEGRPEPLAQARFVVSEHQAEAVFQAAYALGMMVQEAGSAAAPHVAQLGERVLEVASSPAYLKLALVACAEAAWDCGDRMLPLLEEGPAAAAGHHPEPFLRGMLAEQVPTLPPALPHGPAAAVFALASAGLQDSASPASSDTMLAPPAAGPPGPLRFRLLVGQEAAAHLLSRQGAAVCRLQALRDELRAAGCSVRLHDRPKAQPKTSLRCLEVTGSAAAPDRRSRQAPAVHAVLQICAQLQALPAGGAGASVLLAVPRAEGQAGAVIGRGGEVIRGIREASRAVVRVVDALPSVAAADYPAGTDAAGDEFVLVEGPPPAADAALQAVLGHLAAFQASHASQPRGAERPEWRAREVSPDSGAKRLREEVASNSPIVGAFAKRACSHLARGAGSPAPGGAQPSPKRGLRAVECAVLREALLSHKQKNALLDCKDGELPALEAVRRQLARLGLPAHLKLDDARRPDGLRRLEVGGPDARTVADAVNYLNCLLEARGGEVLPPLGECARQPPPLPLAPPC